MTMNHIVDTCPFTKFEGGLNLLHEADDDAVIWLESRDRGIMRLCARIISRIIGDLPHNWANSA